MKTGLFKRNLGNVQKYITIKTRYAVRFTNPFTEFKSCELYLIVEINPTIKRKYSIFLSSVPNLNLNSKMLDKSILKKIIIKPTNAVIYDSFPIKKLAPVNHVLGYIMIKIRVREG
jgi:hypothetical protein